MKASVLNFRILKNTGLLTSTLMLIFVLVFSREMSDGIKTGLRVCFETIIPALFPFLLISSFFLCCKIPDKVILFFDKPMKFLFGISGKSLQAVVAGLTCGYNVAAKNAVKLYGENVADLKQAQRTALFFTSPGISFCINIVGRGIYKSSEVGFKFYVSSIIASLACAAVYNIFFPNSPSLKLSRKNFSFSQALSDSVESASKTIIGICAWIILFYALLQAFNTANISPYVKSFMELFGEVTSGTAYAAEKYSTLVSAFVLNFGGICIFLQQIPDIVKLKIRLSAFLVSRIAVSLLGSVIFFISDYLFPTKFMSSASLTQTQAFSHSPVGSAALMLLCLIFLYCVANGKKRQTNL